jgi:parallel beta-helix repeat protein
MDRFTTTAALITEKNAAKRARLSRFGLAGLVLGCLFAQTSTAVVVGACKGGVHYPTIQQGVAHTPAGGTVSICPGTYPEQVSINKHLTLTGIASGTTDSVVIAAPAAGVVQNATSLADPSAGIGAQVLVVGGVIANFDDIIIDGTNNQISGCGPDLMAIYYQNSSGTVNHVVARNQALSAALNGCQSGEGIFVESGYGTGGTANVTIENSSVHGYQKNGITADGSGTTVTISGNYVVGQGPTTGAAENGIQVSDGAAGTIFSNKVVDDVYSPATFGAAGILVFDSGSLTIQSNTVSNTQFGIVIFSDGATDADNNTISSNSVAATHADDGMDLCSNGNTVKANTVYASDGAGIHLDSSCTEDGGPTGNGNTVSGNTVNEACAGVLLGSGTGNKLSANTNFNVIDTTFAGDVCPAGDNTAEVRSAAAKPVPQRHR